MSASVGPLAPACAPLKTQTLCLHVQTAPACLCAQNPPPNRITMMFAAGATLVSGFNAGSMPARNAVAGRGAVTMQVSEALVAQPVALAKVRTALPPSYLPACAARYPTSKSVLSHAPWAGPLVTSGCEPSYCRPLAPPANSRTRKAPAHRCRFPVGPSTAELKPNLPTGCR